jgi:replicative DNA helicase
MSLERRLLSTLAADPDAIARVWDMGLRSAAFEEPFSQYVYSFIIDYWRSSQMTSAPTAYAIETERPGFKVIADDDEELEEAWWLAEQLIKRFSTNRVQEMMRAAVSTCVSDPVGTLKQLQAATYEAADQITPRHSRSDMTDFQSRRRRYRQEEEHESGVTLGLTELDEQVGYLRPGELAVVGAYAKVGKTMWLLNAAAKARIAGHTPIVFSLEMSIDEIEDRLDAMLSGVSYNRLSKRKLSAPELEHLHGCQELVANMGPVHVESPDQGERTVAHLTARTRNIGADYLIIDQLSHMEETIDARSEKQRVGSILKQLNREIGRESRGKLPCLLACQLNRTSLERPEGPQISDFADAAEVEREADLLLALSRNQEMYHNRMMRMSVLGTRRGQMASWPLHWDLVDQTLIDHVRAADGTIERIAR